MKNQAESLKKYFGKKLILNENLSKYSWFNLGGPAEVFFRPDSVEELIKFLKASVNSFTNINIIGAGSNTLIRDGGIEGLTIKLSSKFSYLKKIDDNTIEAGASTLDKKLSNFAADNSISGFEFLSCIPGSVGGAIIMNCGCFNYEISNILISLNAIDYTGKVIEIKKKDINFYYRGSNLSKDLIITSAKFKGLKSSMELIKAKQDYLINKKDKAQPSKIKTCGSTFKNSEKFKAWELIEKSKCKSLTIGDAQISEKHCNFFVNNGNAKAADVEELISKVKKKVFETTGVKLELEIKVIGKNK